MLSRFVSELFENGAIVIAPMSQRSKADDAATRGVLEEAERSHRLSVPRGAPRWLPEVSLWAAERLFHACRALAYREVEAEEVRASLAVVAPAAPSPEAAYAADVIFRAVPDVLKLARGLSPDDPLSAGLLALARAWPLSSVGVDDAGPFDIGPFVDDRCLRRLYIERIVERSDLKRLDHPRLLEEARSMLGADETLAPELRRYLSSHEVATR